MRIEKKHNSFQNLNHGITNSPIDKLLPRLDKVRRCNPHSWLACCPSHEDKSPSLSIREASDGTLLLKCFAGCSAADIVSAVDLSLADLFPRADSVDYSDGKPVKPKAPPFPWRDAIKSLYRQLLTVQIGAARIAAGDELDERDLDAIGLAALDISTLLEEVRCHG